MIWSAGMPWGAPRFVAVTFAGCAARSLPADPHPQAGDGERSDLDPALVVIAYRDALVQGRARDAFAWIHPDAREGLDAQGFEALYQRHREALIAKAEELVKLAREMPPTQRARVRTDRGDVLLDKTPEGWRLLGPVGGPAL